MDKRKAKGGKGPTKKPEIIDLANYRKNKNEERMREYERILFNRILGVYSFAEKTGLHHVEIVDISFSGIKFREINPDKPYKLGDQLALRFYFTPSSYLRLVMEVKRLEPFEEEGRKGLEYGCVLDKKTRSYDVIKSLVEFMHKYTDTACQDHNPPIIWF